MAEHAAARRATMQDVARRAGVSLATVDRVLNRRPGVSARTMEKVEQAVAEIGFHRDLSASMLARARDIRLDFILPGGANQFMQTLAASIAEETGKAAAERLQIGLHRVPPLDAGALAAVLDALDPAACDCAIVVGSDSAQSRLAVARAAARGLPVLTLVSDLPGTARRQFIGIDNRAAGRTAAALMGRFCGGKGRVGLVAGSLSLTDHRDRYEGFREVMAAEFPAIALAGPSEGFDEAARTEMSVRQLLARHPDLTGIYSMGAGNAGLIAALEAAAKPRPHVILHELTVSTRAALKTGMADVVIDQNPAGEIRAAIAIARHIALAAAGPPPNAAIEIAVFLRDNLR